ncbi:hypothetical protein PG997_013879 [Apiospora hydei]|uniref:Uncharacterized protein n=1 Tax=Apiospora hydei TaxID=1337664 RepID=A0ABR1V8A5_9PEZI
MSTLSADGSTVVLSVYLPGDETVTTTATATTTQFLPSNTATSYITTTKTVSKGRPLPPTATTSTASATVTPSDGVERNTGSAEEDLDVPAPLQPPTAHSANPAVIGGITGTFGKHHQHDNIFLLSVESSQANGVLPSSGSGSYGHPHIHHASAEEAEDRNRR